MFEKKTECMIIPYEKLKLLFVIHYQDLDLSTASCHLTKISSPLRRLRNSLETAPETAVDPTTYLHNGFYVSRFPFRFPVSKPMGAADHSRHRLRHRWTTPTFSVAQAKFDLSNVWSKQQ